MSKVHKHNKNSHFIPSPFPAVTQYENKFISELKSMVEDGIEDVVKYIAETTKDYIKENI